MRRQAAGSDRVNDRFGSFTSLLPVPVYPVCPKSGHSANARTYEYTA
jgi:hypothetical protein